MTKHPKDYLQDLDIPSMEEAAVLERDLNVRFAEFTDADVQTWTRQSRYLKDYAKTRSVTSAAQKAGVSIYIAQAWEQNDTLGFSRRLEVADLEFCDTIKARAMDAACEKPPNLTLLARVLELHFPRDRSSKGRGADDSAAHEVLRLLRKRSHRDLAEWNARTSKPSETADPQAEALRPPHTPRTRKDNP